VAVYADLFMSQRFGGPTVPPSTHPTDRPTDTATLKGEVEWI